VDPVSIKQQPQQLVGKAAVPYNVAGCCEVDKISSYPVEIQCYAALSPLTE